LSDNAGRFFVVTGGPGSGKTTLIEALKGAGFAASVEAGRGIIQDQVAIGGSALPWHNPELFAELMLSWEMRSYYLAQPTTGPVFFDRGVVDMVGYFRLLGLPVPQHVVKASQMFRYHRRVFLAPPWPEIYKQDRERKQDFAEAARTCEAVAAAYTEYGYELVELPREPVGKRTRFVLDAIGLGNNG
jgi:predicted ATPase